MTKAIIIKEWIKTRSVFFIAFAFAMAIAVYSILTMQRLITLKGVDHLWMIMILKDQTFVEMNKYVPAIIGIAVGIAQMVPEMTQKRLKLTLHLPYPMTRLVFLMVATGLVEILMIYLLQAGVVLVYDSTILPGEMVSRVGLTMLPWYLCGLTCYLFTTAICLEGTRGRRVLLGILAVCVALIYFLQPAMEAYNGMIIVLLIAMVVLTILPIGSVIRFKEGRQD